MKIALTLPALRHLQKPAQKALRLFDSRGEVDLTAHGGGALEDLGEFSKDVVINLREGVSWLLTVQRGGILIRYYRVTDEYPIGSKETCETDYWSIRHTSSEEFRELQQTFAKELTRCKSQRRHKYIVARTRAFPDALTDAICEWIDNGATSV